MVSIACVACEQSPPAVGLLCSGCADGLVRGELCPQQIRARHPAPLAGHVNAWLVDGYGMPQVLAVDPKRSHGAAATIGRSASSDVAIAEATVSLAHAVIEHRARSGAWFLLDRESDNGTFVGEARAQRRFPLEAGDRLFFGRRVGFVFVPLDEEQLPRAHAALRWLHQRAPEVQTRADLVLDEPAAPVVVHAVTEGGAVCTVGRERIQLSELEYELLAMLDRRRREEADVDEAARGFVPSGQLLEALVWRSEAPTHANLRVLVRKVRRKLAATEPPVDVIESRQGLGYRLTPLVLVS